MDREVLTLLQTLRTFHLSLRSLRIRSFTMATSRSLQDPVGSSSEKSYENSIKTLNSLQTNSQVLASLAQNRYQSTTNLAETIVYLERGGLSLTQLDALNVIHVAGTKGKGMTCAFVESILRTSGLRTGFFSSPHLVVVRERIRIDGKPLSEQKFTEYFFEVYERLAKMKAEQNDMPAYFRFLTVMAYYVFFQERCDVAIMEVGIGGRYDSTNIVRKPIVVGITSLGLDHQKVLGSTIAEITNQKAGIMKPNVPAVTVHNHSSEVSELLRLQAELVKCPLTIAPPLEEYREGGRIRLGVDDGHVSRINASLAIQLANVFLSQCFPTKLNPNFFNEDSVDFQAGKKYPLQKWHLDGLQHCSWKGRFQVLQPKDNLYYYMDGAHTEESLAAARNWFNSKTSKDSIRILVFYITGNRDTEKLMKPFANDYFDQVLFCPLVIYSSQNYIPNAGQSNAGDIAQSYNWSSVRSDSDEMKNCQMMADVWNKLQMNGTNSKSIILNSIQTVIQYLDSLSSAHQIKCDTTEELVPGKSYQKVNVLFTGSLHMVGSFLSFLDPELSN